MSTLSELRTVARYYIDETTAANWSDAELNIYLKQAHKYYYNKIVQLSEDIFYTSTDYSVTSGSSNRTYSLPSDLMRLRFVENTDDPPVRYMNVPIRDLDNWYDGYIQTSDDTGSRIYSLYGNTISFRGQATETVRMYYIARPTELSSDSVEPFNGLYPEHHDILALRAARLAKVKDEADTGQLQVLEAEMFRNLQDTIVPRSTALRRQVIDLGD